METSVQKPAEDPTKRVRQDASHKRMATSAGKGRSGMYRDYRGYVRIIGGLWENGNYYNGLYRNISVRWHVQGLGAAQGHASNLLLLGISRK